MFKKTTDPLFNKYGFVIKNMQSLDSSFKKSDFKNKSSSNIQELLVCEEEVVICSQDETAILVVSSSLDQDPEYYSIHKCPCIKPNMYFNVLSHLEYTHDFYTKNGATLKASQINEISFNSIQSTFTISEIFAFFYNVKAPGYTFEETQNSYFELVYVDNGKLSCTIDQVEYKINEYEAIVIAPNQRYSQRVEEKSTSYLTVLFGLGMDDWSSLLNRKFTINRDTLEIINRFVKNSETHFPYKNDLMNAYLKIILVDLLNEDYRTSNVKPTTPINQNLEKNLLDEITQYIEDNIFENLYLDTICHDFSLSRSSLQNLFKENLDIAPKQYINKVKLQKSKMLIKESKYTISQIASMLGFNSVHYFSRKFSQYYKLAPTDYAKSIYKKDDSI